MAENLAKRPSKGILKTSSSFEKPDAPKKKHKETKWDEMNIIATLHPLDKDYGHMKIEEPKTPYSWEEGEEPDGLDAKLLAEKIRDGASQPPKGLGTGSDSDDDSDDESPEQKAQRKVFESKRKAHYNEYSAVKLARKLMDEDVEEKDEEESEMVVVSGTEKDTVIDSSDIETPASSSLRVVKDTSDNDSRASDSSCDTV